MLSAETLPAPASHCLPTLHTSSSAGSPIRHFPFVNHFYVPEGCHFGHLEHVRLGLTSDPTQERERRLGQALTTLRPGCRHIVGAGSQLRASPVSSALHRIPEGKIHYRPHFSTKGCEDQKGNLTFPE